MKQSQFPLIYLFICLTPILLHSASLQQSFQFISSLIAAPPKKDRQNSNTQGPKDMLDLPVCFWPTYPDIVYTDTDTLHTQNHQAWELNPWLMSVVIMLTTEPLCSYKPNCLQRFNCSFVCFKSPWWLSRWIYISSSDQLMIRTSCGVGQK